MTSGYFPKHFGPGRHRACNNYLNKNRISACEYFLEERGVLGEKYDCFIQAGLIVPDHVANSYSAACYCYMH